MLHLRMRKFLAALAAFVGLMSLAAPAAATTFKFTGLCTDCTGLGTGTLVLKNYTFGSTLTTSNFVSFSYNSNLLSYSLSSVDDLTGSLGATTGPAFVVLHGGGYAFGSFPLGPVLSPWCTGSSATCGFDYGFFSSWSTAGSVPEPAIWGTMILGFGLLGASMRQSRRLGVTYA